MVGSLAVDRVFRRNVAGPERPGGVVYYAGLTYRHLGHGTAAAFHADLAPAPGLVEPLVRAGVRPHLATALGLTRFDNHLGAGGDGRRQVLLEVAEPIGPALVVEAVTARTRLVHLGPLHPGDIRAGVATALAGRAPAVALDIQGLTRGRTRSGEVVAEVAADIEVFLAAASVVKADSAELELVCECLGTDVAGLLDGFGVDELVETRGRAGGVVHRRLGERIERLEWSPPAVEEGDPTGAGDVLFATYLADRVLRGRAPAACVRHAAAVAAAQVGGRWLRPAG